MAVDTVVQTTRGGDNVFEFYDLFDVVNQILTTFGLSFMERYRDGDRDKYRLSKKRLFYGFLCSLFVLFVFHQQLTRFYPKDMDDNIVVILLYLYMAVVGTLMAILMMVTAAFAAPPLSKLLNNPEFFELFTIRELYRGLKINSIQQIAFSLGVLSACYISDFVADQNFTIMNAIKIFFFFFFPMYNSFCISQFFNTHYWLQGLYWNINQSLESLLDNNWWERQQIQVFGIMEMASSQDRRPEKKSFFAGSGLYKETFIDSANRTVYLVQELLAKAKDGPTRDELHIFCLQLLQEKYEFAPHGFFEMNNKLFLSLIAAVTSYMVILLQYHMVTTALEETKNTLIGNSTSF